MQEAFHDPWHRGAKREVNAVCRSSRSVAAWWLLGSAGPVAQLLVDRFGARALWLAVVAGGWSVLLAARRAVPLWGVACGVFAAVAVLLTWQSAGRAPAMFALLGVAVAAVVISGPGLGQMTANIGAGRLLAVPVVAVAQISWFRGAHRSLSVVGLLAAILVVGYARRRPGPTAAGQRTVTRLVEGVAELAATVVVLLVAIPLLYVPGLVGRWVDRRRRRSTSPSYWTARPATDGIDDARRPFISAPPPQRYRRNVLGLVVVSVFVAAGVALLPTTTVRPSDADRGEDPFRRARDVAFSDLAAFEGDGFADEMKDEQDRFTQGFLVESEDGRGGMLDFSGTFTNVSDGIRTSLEPPPCPRCEEATVWFVGGSAAFGLGQRDEHSIASELVRVAATKGLSLDVVNMAVPGWTLHQEAGKVVSSLEERPAPDLVVFYDGFNDLVASVVDDAAGAADDPGPLLLDNARIRALARHEFDLRAAGPASMAGRRAADRFLSARTSVEAQLRSLGIPVLFVVQPDALAAPEQLDQVRHAYGYEPATMAYLSDALAAGSPMIAEGAVDLRNVLDDVGPVFGDVVHTNERGASVVAGALYPSLAAALNRQAGS